MTRRSIFDAVHQGAPSPASSEREHHGVARLSTRMTAFAVVWALATLLHVWDAPDSHLVLARLVLAGPSSDAITAGAWVHLLLGGTAVAVLLRPSDIRPLILLCALQLASVSVDLPAISNHWLLAGLVSLALLLAVASVVASVVAGRRRLDLAEVERRFVPAAVRTLIVMYAFAAFSKLNSGFLDPVGSCGRFLAGEMIGSLGLHSLAWRPEVGWAGIVTTLLAEGAVAMLLAFRATRTYGVLVGVVFHGLVALNLVSHYFDFSGVLYALFLLALPAGFVPWLRGRFRAPRRILRRLAAFAAMMCLVHWLWPSPFQAPPLTVGAVGLWALYSVLATAVVVGYLRGGARQEPGAQEGARGGSRTPALVLVVPLLAAVNGLAPYLELKTDFSWTMYSNLVTAGGETNHLLVPRTVPLSAEQRHLATIVWADDPTLARYARSGDRVPLVNLRSYVADHPGSELVYEVDGARRTAVPAAADPWLNRPPPAWQEYLQVYESLPGPSPRCLDVKGALR